LYAQALTVVVSESYADFVSDLQSEIKTNLYDRPTKASVEYFKGKSYTVDGETKTITDAEATKIFFYLAQNAYIDEEGTVTDAYRNAAESGTLAPLNAALEPIGESVHKLVQAIFDPSVLAGMVTDGHGTKVKENPLNDNWKDFKELWERINKKYAYTVDFNGDELIAKSIAEIDSKLIVAQLSYTLTKGEQEGTDFTTPKTQTKKLDRASGGFAEYDLIGKIAAETLLTRKTVTAILTGINPQKLWLFRLNPEEFISKVAKLIDSQKASVVVEHITYAPSEEEPYSQDIFNMSKSSDEYAKAFKAKHAIQDYIFTDGTAAQSVERRFAEDLDVADEVVVYAKLPSGPRGFHIPTPVGNYSPDWVITFKKGV
jgi:type III restriction enzyme